MAKQYHDAYVRLRSKPTGRWLVHPDLRGHLVADADRRSTTLTNVVTGILATHYGVRTADGNARSRAASADADILKVRIPIAVWRVVGAAAVATDRDANAVIRETLCSHYGLQVPDA